MEAKLCRVIFVKGQKVSCVYFVFVSFLFQQGSVNGIPHKAKKKIIQIITARRLYLKERKQKHEKMECQAEAAALLPSFSELTSAGVVGRDRHGSPSDGSTDGSQQSQLSSTSESSAELSKELRLSSAHAMIFLSQQKRDSLQPDELSSHESGPTCLPADSDHLMLIQLQDSPHGFYFRSICF